MPTSLWADMRLYECTVLRLLPTAHFMPYTDAVTSSKGVIGIGVPLQPHDESRGLSAESAASLSVPPVLAARMGERKLRRFPQGLSGTPTRSSRRPQLALGASVFANHSTWRPVMAHIAPFTPASSGASPFRLDLPPDEMVAIADLAQGLRADVEEPFRALSVLHQLLRNMDLEGTVPVWGLVSLMEPALSQLEDVRGTVATLVHRLGMGGQS